MSRIFHTYLPLDKASDRYRPEPRSDAAAVKIRRLLVIGMLLFTLLCCCGPMAYGALQLAANLVP